MSSLNSYPKQLHICKIAKNEHNSMQCDQSIYRIDITETDDVSLRVTVTAEFAPCSQEVIHS